MLSKFSVKLLTEAIDFVQKLDPKTREKVIFILNLATRKTDPRLFKKLNEDIWEFRITYNKKTYRLFAFWDKTGKENTLVFCTHGIHKKTQRIPSKELVKAEKIRENYFENKRKTIKMGKSSEQKIVSLEDLTDKYIGKKGTPKRDVFEYELRMEVIGEIVRSARKKRNLTQQELGDLVGVQKAQISKIENNTKSVRIDTFVKVLNALKAKVNLKIEFEENELILQ